MRSKRVSAVILSAVWLASSSCGGPVPDSEDAGGDSGSGGNTAGDGGQATRRDAGADGSVGSDAGNASDAGKADAGGANDAGDRVKPPCLKDPKQVAMLGDSYVAAPSFIGPAIVSAAVSDGALAPGQSYQDLSFPGTTVNSGQIPGQLDSALASYPKLKTVILDGCGNDIIQSIICLVPGADQISACTDIINNCIARFRAMGEKAKAAGATDSIIFQYPDNVPIGGADILRYGVEQGKRVAAEMTTADYRVYLVDTAPLMKDHPDWYVDGLIHVDSRGAKLIGDAIYELMKDHCIAQPESSGCCQPW